MTTGNPCTPSADSQWSLVGNWECLQYHLQRMRRTPPIPAEQRPRPNLTPGSPTAQVQVGIKVTARKITTAGETGWRGPRQDPQMAKSSWPQARNRGLYHRSPRWKPPNAGTKKNILEKPDVDPKCRLCGRFDETIDHLVSGCPELAKTEYIHRHNKAAAHMHWKIYREFGITMSRKQ